MTSPFLIRANLVHDADLAALAMEHGLILCFFAVVTLFAQKLATWAEMHEPRMNSPFGESSRLIRSANLEKR